MRGESRVERSILERLFQRARAGRWGLSIEQFGDVLEASVAYACTRQNAAHVDVEHYLSGLHLEDLGLAAACAAGCEPAWNHFVLDYRPVLYRAADAIDPSGGARDLADALYADLFGLNETRGERRSLFRYFHGRSSLSTWLRAVLSQRHVDRLRAERRFDVLPEDDSPWAGVLTSAASAPDPERARFIDLMRTLLPSVISGLAARDRLRLACYYAQGLTLAEIGRVFGEHEGTVSRHLTRTRRTIREAVEHRLRQEQGFDRAAIDECFRSVVDDAGTLDLGELIGETGGKNRSA